MDSRTDFVQFFIANGVPELVQTILSTLDFYDLKAASLVSKLWRSTVCQERTWKLHLRKLTCDPIMRKIFADMYDTSAHQIDNYFLACRDIMKEQEKLNMNWFNGKYYEEIEPSLFLPEKVTCMEMNSEFIVVGQADGKIVLHSRFEPLVKDFKTSTRESHFVSAGSVAEKGIVLKGSLREVTSLQIDEQNIVVCGGNRGAIEVWNASSKTMLHSLRQEVADRIDCLRFYGHKLFTVGSLQNENSSCITLWNMRTPTNIVYVEKEVFDSQAVVHIGLDSRFLVLLLKQGFSYEIVVRRIEKHTKTNLFSITYQTHYFCGFQYEAGHIVAGCNDGKIRIWDAGTGKCSRVLLRPSCDLGPIAIRFNSKFLVTNSRDGLTIWNFKGAVDKSLPWQTKLRCCFLQTSCSTSREKLFFLMDELEIVKMCEPNRHYETSGLITRLKFQS